MASWFCFKSASYVLTYLTDLIFTVSDFLTVCAEGVVCGADEAGEQRPLQASVVNVQLGQGDCVLDDG